MKYPTKVLFINHSVRDGGPGRSLFYILKYLDKSKVDPLILVPRDDVFTTMVANEGLGDKIMVDARFPENVLRPRFNWLRRESEPGALSQLLNVLSVIWNVIDLGVLVITSPHLIRRHGIRIIYCNGTVAKIAGAFMGAFSRRPVIWHVRNIQQKRALKLTMNLLSGLGAVKKIICVSGATARQFERRSDKISVIHNGIDLSDFDPEKTSGVLRHEFNLPEGAIVIGSTGRIVPRKGYPHLIRAALAVRTKLGGDISRIRFVVVGDTPHFFQDNHLQHLKRMVGEYKLEDLFVFTGYRKNVRPYLRDFDVFVIPSNYPDPFPRVVLEAMAFGLPVIGFRVGGIVEAVENNVTGILCPPGDTEHMGESILKLIDEPQLRLSMGNAGRERVKNLFLARDRTKDVERDIVEVAEKWVK